MKNYVLIFLIILTIGCKNEKPDKKIDLDDYVEKKEVPKTDRKIDTLIRDSTLIRKGPAYFITLTDGKKRDSIIAFCSCQKDKKNNTIKIQLTTAIPTKKELDTLKETDRKSNKVLQLIDLGYLDDINGQFKFLTIEIKDSLIQNIRLLSKSTDPEYDEKYFDSTSIKSYKIQISKFDYSIASDIYGDFKIVLEEDFGLFEKDRNVKGYFECNNWRITTKEEIMEWNIKESFEKRNENRGFRVIE
ncbi:hypothetical protein [Gillisia limnaea]|uniref:Lipoprotein n=1 Tax=Gillisia limnaea (strain DSM 15749 / LMG 21470 / R-8282) TaxID=865937 RepID=H2BQJ7_GILLR|nr:hypothetical protein [Gillisia limnaea]EHQ04166.1 hypothetical protein Gilli_0002 [Gillisia limnaea DSM 15749]